jgi:hypothetical protein
VPLHYLKTLDLEREVGDYAKLHGFPANPLDTEAGERRLLLILDGLDELDADKRGRDAAAALVTAVRHLLLKNNHNFEIQVVLAGRALIVENLQGELNRERQTFHVLGYAPRKSDDEWHDPAERLAVDQRQAWWHCWGSHSGENLAGMPAEIEDNENLADLADQPLLNHLLAITRAADPAALDASSSVNSVYARLLRHVWERSWGEKRQIAGVKPLTPEQFTQLFESIGLAVWQHGGRSTTLAEVAAIAKLEKLDTELPVFKEGAEKGALALLTAFFFRRAGSHETFELTHKSFGEYLAARRLGRLIEDLHRLLPNGDIDEGEGLRRWYRLTYAARVTVEILEFLENELGALPARRSAEASSNADRALRRKPRRWHAIPGSRNSGTAQDVPRSRAFHSVGRAGASRHDRRVHARHHRQDGGAGARRAARSHSLVAGLAGP